MADLEDRLAFQGYAIEHILPAVEPSPFYGGNYFDQLRDGQLVVVLSASDPKTTNALTEAAGAYASRMTVISSSITQTDLETAVDRSGAAWAAVMADTPLISAGTDLPNMQVVLTVAADNVGTATARQKLLQSAIGVPVAIREGTAPDDLSWTDRNHCSSPMKAGDLIHPYAPFAMQTCSTAFTVKSGSAYRFMTAGHCPYTTDWYHQGYSGSNPVGSSVATDYPTMPNVVGVDSQLVSMPSSQAGTGIYASSRVVGGSTWGSNGQAICTSLGFSNTIDCETISNSYTTWHSTTCNCTVYGGQASSITAIEGDSGSPVWVNATDPGYALALGVVAAGSGSTLYYARVNNVLADLGVTLLTSP
ncbi:MAG TPA: hypothetical protein VGI98_07210 [Candidatus Limnocylindrales bacterium]